MRAEVKGNDEAIELLQRQLQGVQDTAVLEMETQIASFGNTTIRFESEAREIARIAVGQAHVVLMQVFSVQVSQLRRVSAKT